MKRKLLLLNLGLIALIGAGAWQFRGVIAAARVREKSIEARRPTNVPLAPPAPETAPPSVQAAAYADVAQKPLFWKDRNSIVIQEPPPVKEVKPLPPFPVLYGVMNLGAGPVLMMSEKGAARHRGIRVGDQIGEYKVVAFEDEAVTLEFEDRKVRKPRAELSPAPDAPQPGQVGGQVQAASAAPTPPPQVKDAKPEPGADAGPGTRSCIPGDNSPDGTVSQGYRKVLKPTPFGISCRWDKI